MSFPQLGYPQYLSASQAVYGGDRPGVLTPSSRGGSAEIGGSASAAAAAVSSVLGMYPYAHNYSAFLPYTSADLALFSQMGSQYDLKDSPGVHPASFAAHASPAFYPYGQFQYGDPSRPKNATRESTSTLKAWLNEHRKNPYPTKGEKIMLAIITKMTLTQVSTWFANARRRLKKENKVTWGRSKEDEDANIFGSDNEGDAEKNEDDEEIDLESIDIDKIDENDGDQSNEEDEEKRGELERLHAHEAFEKSKPNTISGSKEPSDGNNNNTSVLSPGRQGGFPVPVSNKPKIWSLAETATSPDSLQKPTSPSVPATHPAFLPSHGLYTCQIGKFHNWTNGAFLGQNSLLNVRSFLGVSHQHTHPVQQQHSSGAAVNSDKAPEDLSPKHIDRENVLRNESPTQPLKSSFRPLHDSPRNQQESTQRVLTALSSA
ncbi:iroquois-class homeodomain protein irx-1-like [Carassius auratus]|uniref:Iroquois-class homeodomain protein irx-1-like n=1 Tax=Carassius auratus TaxID=7957 RepID=A0A6P6LM07_CARAU|nr:iroquois-class homeodomain protein irx-1-like [Carassius auratus]